MKILAVGDPHGDAKVLKIPVPKDIDAIFITGDLGRSDLIRKHYFEYVIKRGLKTWKDAVPKKELEKAYLETINSSYEILKYFSSKKPTFYVLGNIKEIRTETILEDSKKYGITLPLFEKKISKLKNLKNVGLSVITFKGVKIVGIPYFESLDWVERFSPENKKLIDLAKKEEPIVYNFINDLPYVDILLTHIPPYGILDTIDSSHVPKNWLGKHAGDKKILDYVKKKRPKVVFCGHIHEAKGLKMIDKTNVYNLGSSGDFKIITIQ